MYVDIYTTIYINHIYLFIRYNDMSYRHMLDKVMQSGKRLLHDDDDRYDDGEEKESGEEKGLGLYDRYTMNDQYVNMRNGGDRYDDSRDVDSRDVVSQSEGHDESRGAGMNGATKSNNHSSNNGKDQTKKQVGNSFQVVLTEKSSVSQHNAHKQKVEFTKKKSAKKIDTAMPLKQPVNKRIGVAAEPRVRETKDNIVLRDNTKPAVRVSKSPITPSVQARNKSNNIKASNNRASKEVKKNLTPQRSPNPSPKSKHLLSVQEEFVRHKTRQSTPKKTPQAAEEENSMQETMDIYKKYDFLKSGQVKITHKAAKYIVGRIKPAKCLVHLLDSLFILVGENKLKLDEKVRFSEYRTSLTKVESLNSALNKVFIEIRDDPNKYTGRVVLSSKALEKFYNESIFSDLVTLEHCKEVLWICQGLTRFHQKCMETSEDFPPLAEFGMSTSSQSRKQEVISQHEHKAKQNSVSGSHLSGEGISRQDSSKDLYANIGRTHFSYTVDEVPGGGRDESEWREERGARQEREEEEREERRAREEEREDYQEEEVDYRKEHRRESLNNGQNRLGSGEPDQRDFISFGRGEESHAVSMSSHNQDTDINRISEMHKQKVREMMERMQRDRQVQEEEAPNEESRREEYTLEPIASETNQYMKSPKSVLVESGEGDLRQSWGGDQDREIKIDDVSHDRNDVRVYNQVKRTLGGGAEKSLKSHAVYQQIEKTVGSLLSTKTMMIIKNIPEYSPLASAALRSLILLYNDVVKRDTGEKRDLEGDSRSVKKALSSCEKVEQVLGEVHRPHVLLGLNPSTVRSMEGLLSSERGGEEGVDYYTTKVVEFIDNVIVLYRYAKDAPDVYAQIHTQTDS